MWTRLFPAAPGSRLRVLVSGELYEAVVLYPAGDFADASYAYRKDNGYVTETIAHRPLLLPTDGTTEVFLSADSWDNAPITCGGAAVPVKKASWGSIKGIFR